MGSDVPPTPTRSSVCQQNRTTSMVTAPDATEVQQATPTRFPVHQHQKKLPAKDCTYPTVFKETSVTLANNRTIAVDNAYVGEDQDGNKDKDVDIDKDKGEDEVTATGNDQGDNKFNEGDDKVNKGEDKVADIANNKGDNSINKDNKDDYNVNVINHNFVEDSFFYQTHSWMLSRKLVMKYVSPTILLQQEEHLILKTLMNVILHQRSLIVLK